MYYIPKGKPMHEKLSTTFVRMEGLLEELKAENFSGYIYLTFPQTSGYLFIQDGKVINAAEIAGQDQRAGMAIQEQLIRLSQQAKGSLSVYYLQKEIVRTLAGIADGEVIYSNLTSDWANIAKLIKKLASERRTYFINLAFESVNNKKRGLIFVEGDTVEAACATGDDHLFGPEALNSLTKDSETEVAIFNVYRQANSAAIPPIDDKEVEASLNRLISQANAQPAPGVTVTPPPATPAPPQVQVTPQPVQTAPAAPPSANVTTASTTTAPTAAPAAPYYESLLPSGSKSEPVVAEAPVVEVKAKANSFEDILEVVEVEAPARPTLLPNGQAASPVATTVSAAQVTPAPLPETPKSGNEMRDLMQLMSQVVAAVERGMTVAGRGSSFPTALRAGLLAVTERYPFLDPFAAEFEYQDKEIVFVGTAQPVEFAAGLSEALRQMVEDLIYSSNGRVRDYIAEELRKVEREQANDIRRFNLGNLTEKICQH
ncbi:MAG: hypothetical protein JST84_03215 [Acidobacteria bacterium]|nr:hypothetical protein [Acidobacteriota bacterium]